MTTAIGKIERTHFIVLAVLLCGFGLNLLFDVGINSYLAVVLKGIVYLSGIILFFASLRPFKAISIYYLWYVMSPVVVAALYFFHGIFLAILSSIAIAPVMPLGPEYNKDGVKVYSTSKGFFGSCCDYYATEATMLVFEKKKGTIRTEMPIDFENVDVRLENDSILIYPGKP